MALCKEILLPNGTTGNYHIIDEILRLDYERKICNVKVASYSSKESFENGDEPVDRNKEVYNKTMARLLCRIRSVWSYGGVDRHCDPQDLWDIMEADDIPKDKWKSLYNSAYYYFDVERGVR